MLVSSALYQPEWVLIALGMAAVVLRYASANAHACKPQEVQELRRQRVRRAQGFGIIQLRSHV